MQITYEATEYENETLNWISKHAFELLMTSMLAVLAWNLKLTLDIKDQQTINTVQIEHLDARVEDINHAVNDVDKHENTLRELVEQTRTDVKILKLRTEEK